MIFERKQLKSGECPYCEGAGYFQLRLGGTETCDHCTGEGKSYETKAAQR
ncbi:YuiA family protein [Desertibacillus haloalkaliphilus]|nr:YuiA family protein [Desertibacillus haloalkaliphilus]MBU8905384.1 YuiA family protein [Desertibacillus haloalkaliphilus]